LGSRLVVLEDSKFLAMVLTIGPFAFIIRFELVGDEEADELPDEEVSLLLVVRLCDENEFSDDIKPLSVSLTGSVLRLRKELDRFT